jgi:putative colanic acid biosynthesis UDP-glucose lipid carrier transferase
MIKVPVLPQINSFLRRYISAGSFLLSYENQKKDEPVTRQPQKWLLKNIQTNILKTINMMKTFMRSLPYASSELYNADKEAKRFTKLKVVKPVVFEQLSLDTATTSSFSADHPLNNQSHAVVKRTFDVVFSLFVCFFILSWLVPIIAILIKLESKGPVFFKQLRTGKDNKAFFCYKFRSLKMNDEADKKQVTSNDKRVTRIGKFLRKSSIDEMPQFINVLLGQMSIVGPRPHMLKHTDDFSEVVKNYKVRHLVKPGVTGLAQVSGFRGEILHEDQLIKRVEKDFNYIENWNIFLDLKIIYLTVYNTFANNENAY